MRKFLMGSAAVGFLALTSVAGAQFRYPPYPSYRYTDPESDLRIAVKPKEASVYVDGYFAGKVEEFDGAFQRLHVIPGQHEITVYLEGYRPLSQKLYLSPRGKRKIEGTLEKLAPGETMPPPPEPVQPPPAAPENGREQPQRPRR